MTPRSTTRTSHAQDAPPKAMRRRARCLGIRHATLAVAALLALLAGPDVSPAAAACIGDCNGDGRVTAREVLLGHKIRRGRMPLSACPSLDADGDGTVVRAENRLSVKSRQRGCKAQPTPTATPAQPAGARLEVAIANPGTRALAVMVWGARLAGPTTSAPTSYGPLTVDGAPGSPAVAVLDGLAPGEWLHRIEVAQTGQRQARRSLLVRDGERANHIGWTAYASVLLVNRAGDDGDGDCDASCTLRDALDSAAAAAPPALVLFDQGALDGAVIEITRNEPLLLTAPAMAIDGGDLRGHPSPLAEFAERRHPTAIRLRAPNAGGATAPCNESPGGSLRVAAAGVEIHGIAVARAFAPEGTICVGDQDLLAFDSGSRGSRLSTALLDGGAAAIRSAEVPSGETLAATGKDCIDASGSRAAGEEAVLVENSEIRFCHDRGVKSQSGWLRLRRNWIHHNLRGGVFAQSPVADDEIGGIDARDNLIEANGLNCPSGDPRDCGPEQVVARGGASDLSAQGRRISLWSNGDIVRDGAMHGFFFEDGSEGRIADSYVCGIRNSAGGKGVLVQRDSGAMEDVRLRGTAVVYNDDAGVKVRGRGGVDLGTDTDPGRNAFAQNGSGVRRNVVNAMDAPVPMVPASGNFWERCYGEGGAQDCDERAVCDLDANNTVGQLDRVDAMAAIPHQSAAPVALHAAEPARVARGGIVRLVGEGFDAISGHSGGVEGDCHALAAGNSCAPLSGTCVEFWDGGAWRPALDVLAVTPTSVTVRSPLDCREPVPVRVRRAVRGGGEAVSAPLSFCRAE